MLEEWSYSFHIHVINHLKVFSWKMNEDWLSGIDHMADGAIWGGKQHFTAQHMPFYVGSTYDTENHTIVFASSCTIFSLHCLPTHQSNAINDAMNDVIMVKVDGEKQRVILYIIHSRYLYLHFVLGIWLATLCCFEVPPACTSRLLPDNRPTIYIQYYHTVVTPACVHSVHIMTPLWCMTLHP